MLKNKAIAQKLGSVMLAGLVVLAAGVATGAAPASATTTCNTWVIEREVPGLNQFRAGISCGDIDDDIKVRLHVIREAAPDYYSPWITTENETYYTDWYTCHAGCTVGLQSAPR